MAATSVDSPRSVKPLAHDQDKALAILRRLDAPPRKSMSAAEISATQHAMPKTYVSRALLHENPSHDRHLSMTMNKLSRRQHQYESNYHMSIKKFIDNQQRKHKTWKHQDETKAANINFPTLRAHATPSSQPKGSVSGRLDVLYKSPRYFDQEDDEVELPEGNSRILPYMQIRRERTEFVKYKEKTFVQRLPTVILNNSVKMERYNTYCGREMLSRGVPVKDDRFRKLANALSQTKEDFENEDGYDVAKSDDEEEDEFANRNIHKHLVTQSLTSTPRFDKRRVNLVPPTSISAGIWRADAVKAGLTSNKSASVSETLRQSPTSVKRSRVVFPSLQRSSTVPDAMTKKTVGNAKVSLTRERTEASLKFSSSKRDTIKNDLKNSGVDGLRHRYGKLKCSYKEHDIMEEDGEESSSDEEPGESGYESLTLKRKFNVKTLRKTQAEEE